MKTLIKNGNSVIAVLDNGTMLQNNNCDDAMFEILRTASDEEALRILLPQYEESLEKRAEVEELFDKVKKSQLLSSKGTSIYWLAVSELSMPEDLVKKVLHAEENGNEAALESYKNFWTLLSLNPDERVRQHLFWFLSRWGMCISKTGLFVGYRNVDVADRGGIAIYDQKLCDFVKTEYESVVACGDDPDELFVYNDGYGWASRTHDDFDDSDDEDYDGPYWDDDYNLAELYNEFKAVRFKAKNIGDDTVFTDHHSHTFKIKIGEMVTMPREDCNCDSDVSCTNGLHLGGTSWLNKHYFGDQGLVCLCNPTDVVAVPHADDYGKLRTCAYLPIALCDYDPQGHVIPYNVEDGFNSRWVKTVLYDGIVSTEEQPAYAIDIPSIPELQKSNVTEAVLEIARKYMRK